MILRRNGWILKSLAQSTMASEESIVYVQVPNGLKFIFYRAHDQIGIDKLCGQGTADLHTLHTTRKGS